jgi:hypothetical protein
MALLLLKKIHAKMYAYHDVETKKNKITMMVNSWIHFRKARIVFRYHKHIQL